MPPPLFVVAIVPFANLATGLSPASLPAITALPPTVSLAGVSFTSLDIQMAPPFFAALFPAITAVPSMVIWIFGFAALLLALIAAPMPTVDASVMKPPLICSVPPLFRFTAWMSPFTSF